MARNLYLIEAKARYDYTCEACGILIGRGKFYFRHDPLPRYMNPRGRRPPRTHWCRECVQAAEPGPPDKITGRLLIPIVRVVARTDHAFRPLRIEILRITDLLVEQL